MAISRQLTGGQWTDSSVKKLTSVSSSLRKLSLREASKFRKSRSGSLNLCHTDLFLAQTVPCYRILSCALYVLKNLLDSSCILPV